MFRDPEARYWPTQIEELTATAIIVNAIEEHLGGEALDSEMEPDNPKTVQAMKDLEKLTELLWKRHGRGGKWGDLAAALERSLSAKKEYLEDLSSKFKGKEIKAS